MNPHFKASKTFENLHDKYTIVDDVWEGTEAMRREGNTYLQKEPKETSANYQMRLDRSVMEPVFKRVIMQSVGKAFTKPIQVDGVPSSLEPLIFNADQSGTSLESFSKDILNDAIKYGITYLLTDFPVIEPNSTLADERLAGAYPYFVNIKPTQVLDLSVGYIDGLAQLINFRFFEEVSEYDGFTTVSQYQVKQFSFDESGNVSYTIWREDKNGNEYLYDKNIIRNMKRIPITPVYANKISPFLGEPTLLDLAYLNIQHYQKTSDVDVALHYGAMPMLVIKGMKDQIDPTTGESTNEIVISPNSGFHVDSDGDVSWLELNGSGISTYMQNINELKASMSLLGLELTTPKAIHETATGRLLDEHTKNSILKVITIDLASSLERALWYAGQYMAEEVDATVTIDTTLTVTPDAGIENVLAMVKAGILTPSQALKEITERRLLLTNPQNDESIN